MKYEELRDAALKLQESIIEEPDSYPNSKDKLFTDVREYWQYNACVDKLNGIQPYAAGYLDAAKLLSRIIIYSQRGMDTMLYPLAYLYRHYIEITLKDLIRRGVYITDSSIDKKLESTLVDHNLMKLWNAFLPLFDEILGDNDSQNEIKKGIESYINQIHAIDPTSMTFRYNTGKASVDHHLNGVERINILHFSDNMEKLTSILEGIDMEFDAITEYVNDMKMEFSEP